MRNHTTVRLIQSIGLGMIISGGGCSPEWQPAANPPPRLESIVVEHQTEGTNRAMCVQGDVWYQLVGNQVLILDEQGREINRLRMAPDGASPPAIDVIAMDGRLAVLLGDGEISLFDIQSPWRPTVIERIGPGDIGDHGESLTILDGELVALCGDTARSMTGDVVARSDGPTLTSILDQGGRRLHVAGRRIHRRAGDAYLGTASLLEIAAPDDSPPDGVFVFARQERNGSLVGLLGEDCREVDPERWTLGVSGNVQRLRQRDSRILVVSDRGLQMLRRTQTGLVREWIWQQQGIWDADWLNEDRIAVSGSMGRGIIHAGSSRPEPTAGVWHPTAGGLTAAASDGEALVASSPTGNWRYVVGKDPQRIDSIDEPLQSPPREAAVLGWLIQIDEHGKATLTGPDGSQTIRPATGGDFHCVMATEDAFWLGHDDGILLLMLQSGEEGASETAVRRLGVLVDGPVICIEPLVLGGGVAYASQNGGFGVVREVY